MGTQVVDEALVGLVQRGERLVETTAQLGDLAFTLLDTAGWETIGGEAVLIAAEENAPTIAMFTGLSAPQPPPPGTTFGAGCRIGRSTG